MYIRIFCSRLIKVRKTDNTRGKNVCVIELSVKRRHKCHHYLTSKCPVLYYYFQKLTAFHEVFSPVLNGNNGTSGLLMYGRTDQCVRTWLVFRVLQTYFIGIWQDFLDGDPLIPRLFLPKHRRRHTSVHRVELKPKVPIFEL
jgi:hypothetical protein